MSWWRRLFELLPEATPAVMRRAPIPLVVWDEPWTDKTQVVSLPVGAGDVTDGNVQPQPKFAPPRASERPRVKPVVVRVTTAEWRALVRAARPGEDLGDALRRWANLPPIKRGV